MVEVAESSELAPERLAEPLRALEAGATPELVRLGLWVAREYCSTPARGLELVLPPGIGRDGQGVGPRLELMVASTEAGRAALDDGTRLGRRQRDALAALVREGPLPSGEIPATELEAGAAVTRETLKRLEARGLVALRARERRRRPSVAAVGAPSHQPRLAPQQQRALAEIVAAIEGAAPRELLLHGVTGSGKTEVYIAAAEAALQRGRGAIVLVPEIALTPQIVARFASRFGDRVALLHSRCRAGSAGTNGSAWQSGEARICVGPRSAVFAPVADLGLVVIERSTTPPTSRRAIPATTPARLPGTERPKTAPRSWRAAPRPGRRPGWRCRGSSFPLAPTAGRSRRLSWSTSGGARLGPGRCIHGRSRRSPRSPTKARRRSCS